MVCPFLLCLGVQLPFSSPKCLKNATREQPAWIWGLLSGSLQRIGGWAKYALSLSLSLVFSTQGEGERSLGYIALPGKRHSEVSSLRGTGKSIGQCRSEHPSFPVPGREQGLGRVEETSRPSPIDGMEELAKGSGGVFGIGLLPASACLTRESCWGQAEAPPP